MEAMEVFMLGWVVHLWSSFSFGQEFTLVKSFREVGCCRKLGSCTLFTQALSSWKEHAWCASLQLLEGVSCSPGKSLAPERSFMLLRPSLEHPDGVLRLFAQVLSTWKEFRASSPTSWARERSSVSYYAASGHRNTTPMIQIYVENKEVHDIGPR